MRQFLFSQVVKAASPALLRVIALGAFLIYCTVSMINNLFWLKTSSKNFQLIKFVLNEIDILTMRENFLVLRLRALNKFVQCFTKIVCNTLLASETSIV
jgi:hypothetical protein